MIKNKYLVPFLLTVVLPGSILILLTIFGVTSTFNRKLSDILFHLLPSHYQFSKDIVIIDIDEQSIAKYADHPELGQWPWKRTIYPTLINYTKLLTPPKITIIDIMFTERSDYDEAVVAANTNLGSISHAANFRNGGFVIPRRGGESSIIQKFSVGLPEHVHFPEYDNASFPIGEIGETAPFLHVVNVVTDKDGILRRFSPFTKWKDHYFPTLATQGFAAGDIYEVNVSEDEVTLSKENKTRTIPVDKDGLTRAYFYTEAELRSIPRYSAAGIIQSLEDLNSGAVDSPDKLIVPPTLFDNKIVLIGTSAAATHDDVVTPFGLFPGVIAQAVFASNLMEGHLLQELPDFWGVLLTLCIIVLGMIILFVSENHILRNLYPIFAVSLFLVIFYILYRLDMVLPPLSFITTFPVSYLIGFAYLTYKEGQEKRKYNNILRNLVDPGVVSEAMEDMENLRKGGEWEITAFFSDVANFSTISEELSASDLARLLNEYLTSMTEILKSNSGTLDKYIGDAIVGIFGAPIKNTSHPRLACKTALEMLDALEKLRSEWILRNDFTDSARNMLFRIGLNCGPAKVGFMGTDSLASYTMMGDTVNLAARLEAAAKDYGVPILVSEAIETECKGEFHFRFLDWIRVKGKDKPVKIFSLVCHRDEVTSEFLAAEDEFRKAFEFYVQKNWEKAVSGFESAKKAFGKQDRATNLLIERCQFLFQNPPPDSWDGVFSRSTK